MMSESDNYALQESRKEIYCSLGCLAAGDCNVMELMIIAGRRTDPVVARIVPRLVFVTA